MIYLTDISRICSTTYTNFIWMFLMKIFLYPKLSNRASQVVLVVKNVPTNTGDLRDAGSFNPWVRKIPWRRNGNPLQYSCLGNSMGRGAWRATVHVVAKSRTRLSSWHWGREASHQENLAQLPLAVTKAVVWLIFISLRSLFYFFFFWIVFILSSTSLIGRFTVWFFLVLNDMLFLPAIFIY